MIQLPYQHHHHAQSVTSTRRFGVSWAGRWTEGIQIPPALFHVCLVRSIAILAMTPHNFGGVRVETSRVETVQLELGLGRR
eukprot:scaffold7551_cov123-Isochrysis_galbana.AAC.13